MVATHYGTSCYAGTAGIRLILDTTFVSTHKEASIGQVFDKVDIRALREQVGAVAQPASLADDIVVVQILDAHHIVR